MKKGKYTLYVPGFRTPVEPQREILDPIADIITRNAKVNKELISIQTRQKMVTTLAKNIVDILEGQKIAPTFIVNSEVFSMGHRSKA